MNAKEIQAAYYQYVVDNAKRPLNLAGFLLAIGIDEKAFLVHFKSLWEVEQHIWADAFDTVVAKMQAEAVYAEYSVREKVLALFFTFLEQIKRGRVFYVDTLNPMSNFRLTSDVLALLEARCKAFIEELVQEGIYSGEIVDRPFLTAHYATVLWGDFALMLRFWAKDSSPNNENTDVFTEKSLNLAFDLLGRNIADSSFDLAKFLFQQVRR